MSLTREELESLREMARYGYEQRLIEQGKASVQTPVAAAPVQPYQPHPVTGVVPFSEADKAFLRTDEKGEVVAMPGAPEGILSRWHLHVRTRQEYLNRLANEPEKVFGTMVEEKAREVAEKMFQEQFSRTTQQQQVDKILEDNKNWLYQHDASGQMQTDAMGVPKLSAAGTLYRDFLTKARDAGMTNQVAMHEFARMAVLGHMAEQRLSRPPVAPVAPAAPVQDRALLEAQAKENLLFQAQQHAAMAPATGGAMLTPPQKRASFADMARQDAQSLGMKL